MGMSAILVCILFAFASRVHISGGASIFVISNLPSGSHALWYGKLANLLAQRGHEIVLLGTGPFKSKSENITFVQIEDSYGWLKTVEQVIESTSLLDMVGGLSSATDNIRSTSDWSLNECENFLKSQGSKTIMEKYKDKHFDLIIVDFICESFFGFVHFFNNPPYIIATPYNNANWIFDAVGLYDNPSYVPTSFSPFQPKMNFIERVLNTYYKLYTIYIWNFYNIPHEDKLAKEVFGSSVPPVTDIMKNVSLLLVGTNPVLTGPKPLPPAYIPIGGFHIDKVKPLPQDIKKFMDDAKDGVIYFSFGSNFKSIFMTPEMINVFLDTFKEIPQRVVWKLELENKTGIPDNVLISKWLPQNDILGHPNVRCFISHGGLLGTEEAIYHGVPILGLPFMFDQLDILKNLEHNGVGIQLEFSKLSKEYIKANIQKVLQKSYQDKMQEWSKIFKDAPFKPDERAIWWVEYVLRNPTEIKTYLRSQSLELYWFQRLLLDVAAVILIPLVLVIYISCSLIKYLISKCGKKNVKASKTKNKKE